jgi:arylsulfatase A-like enzyme
MNSRRDFLRAACLGGASIALSPAAARRPNFLVLLTDDQRFDTVRALGHPEVRTPNMDRLAARGVAFTHACIQGGLVPAVCMPSRAQLMTGRSVFRVHQQVIPQQDAPGPSIVTFPQRLREAGYVTFGTGKWHNGPALFNRSFSHGGSIFFGGMADHLKTPVFEYDPSGKYPKQNSRLAGEFSSRAFASEAVRFLKERDRSKPFLTYVAFTSPHDPRMAPREFEDLFPPSKVTLPKNFLPVHPFDNGEMTVRDEMLAPVPRTADEIRRHIAAYYAMIAEVDANIGRVLDALEQSGEAGNTYVIWAADNGLAVGQHGLLGKQNLYDHSLRVPMVIAGPGIPAGRRAHSMCHLMDLCPTICELAGVPPPQPLDARSLRPAFSNQSAPLRDVVVAAYRNVQRALRTDRWKLVLYNVEGRKTVQLFDLREDPLEMKNLAEDGAYAKRVAELKALLARELRAAGDTIDLDAAVWPA